MEDQLITYETALLAREKGFRELVRNSYSLNPEFDHHLIDEDYLEDWNNMRAVSAPSQSFLQRWLREEHNKRITVWDYYTKGYYYAINGTTDTDKQLLSSYEEALEKGLYASLKLI